MKIHSSSLSFSPIGLNKKVGRNDSAQNNDQHTASAAKDTLDKKVNLPSSPEQIKKALDNASFGIEVKSQDNIIRPTNSRTSRALSAYNQEFNAPLQAQRAQLITGIDAYA